jgi:hypothetical protein
MRDLHRRSATGDDLAGRGVGQGAVDVGSPGEVHRSLDDELATNDKEADSGDEPALYW